MSNFQFLTHKKRWTYSHPNLFGVLNHFGGWKGGLRNSLSTPSLEKLLQPSALTHSTATLFLRIKSGFTTPEPGSQHKVTGTPLPICPALGFVNKCIVTPTETCPFVYILSMAAFLLVVEVNSPQRDKYLLSCSLQTEPTDPWLRGRAL